MYILNELLTNRINQALTIKYPGQSVSTLPSDPPFLTMTKGGHTTKIKLGKLFSCLPLADKEVKELVEEYKEINGDLSQFSLKYTRNNYVEAYEVPLYALGSTFKSCMSNMDCVSVYNYDENLELLEVYKEVEKESALIGRTLVAWRKSEEEQSVFIQLYIDHNHIKEYQMKSIVAKQGLVKGSLEGIKLRRLDAGYRGIVCPYLDGDVKSLSDHGDYLLVTRGGELDGSSTEGTIRDESFCCEDCGACVHKDDMSCVFDREICSDCVASNYTDFEYDYYHNADCITTSDTNESIPLAETEANDIYEDKNGDYYHIYNLVTIDDELVYIEDAYKLQVEVDEDTRYALKEDCIRLAVDINGADEGWYLKEQLEDIKAEVVALIFNLQGHISSKGEFMLPNQELADLLTALEVLEELL